MTTAHLDVEAASGTVLAAVPSSSSTPRASDTRPSAKPTPRTLHAIPPELLADEHIGSTIAASGLPAHYNFELYKTIWAVRRHAARCVALQLPEGLMMFATSIANVLEECAYPRARRDSPEESNAEENEEGRNADDDDSKAKMTDDDTTSPQLTTVIMADVTYGACCVDDFTARALGCDLLVHYGHSCLIPVTTTAMPTLYIFVDIQFDVDRFVRSVVHNFPPAQYAQRSVNVVGTVQFAASLPGVCETLRTEHGYERVVMPQERPLSKSEVLGCTSPRVADADLIIYVGDGRFHLESIMLANPGLTRNGEVYRYDPYTRKFTREHYAHDAAMDARRLAIESARIRMGLDEDAVMKGDRRSSDVPPSVVGILWGTLGRQGSPAVVRHLQEQVERHGGDRLRAVTVLLSEISPQRLALFGDEGEKLSENGGAARARTTIGTWIQTSCPRLSIDWGYAFDRPLLSPYEAAVALLSGVEYRARTPGWLQKSKAREGLGTGCTGNANESCSDTEFKACTGNETPAIDTTTTPLTMPVHDDYPMDFYSKNSLGPWTPNYTPPQSMSSKSTSGSGGASWKERLAMRRLAKNATTTLQPASASTKSPITP